MFILKKKLINFLIWFINNDDNYKTFRSENLHHNHQKNRAFLDYHNIGNKYLLQLIVDYMLCHNLFEIGMIDVQPDLKIITYLFAGLFIFFGEIYNSSFVESKLDF